MKKISVYLVSVFLALCVGGFLDTSYAQNPHSRGRNNAAQGANQTTNPDQENGSAAHGHGRGGAARGANQTTSPDQNNGPTRGETGGPRAQSQSGGPATQGRTGGAPTQGQPAGPATQGGGLPPGLAKRGGNLPPDWKCTKKRMAVISLLASTKAMATGAL